MSLCSPLYGVFPGLLGQFTLVTYLRQNNFFTGPATRNALAARNNDAEVIGKISVILTVSEVRAVTKISVFFVNTPGREGDDTTRDFFLSFVLPNFYEVTTVEVITDVAVNHTTMETSPTFSG